MLDVLKSIALALIFSGCVAFPVPPSVPLCMYDNYSKEDKSDRSPNFKCIAANGEEFKIMWNSPSAKNMVGTPHDDYVKLQAYYKKLFDVFEKEFLKKAGR